MKKNIPNSFDMSHFWLYTDLRQIVNPENTLETIIKSLNSLNKFENEDSITKVICSIRDVCYSIDITQRSKLFKFFITKASENIDNLSNESHVKSLLIFIYCLIIFGYRDQNKYSKETSEINDCIKQIEDEILTKISLNSEINTKSAHIYMFCCTFIRQLQLWLISIKYSEMKAIIMPENIMSHDDSISKSLIFLHKRLTEANCPPSKPLVFLLIATFHGFMKRKVLRKLFISEHNAVPVKRIAQIETTETSTPKKPKCQYTITDIENELKLKNFLPVAEKLTELINQNSKSLLENSQELIEILKLTPLIIRGSQKCLTNDPTVDRSLHEDIHINIFKLWTIGMKLQLVTQMMKEGYLGFLLSLDIKGFVKLRPMIIEMMTVLINLLSVIRNKILGGPWLATRMINPCLEAVLHQSTMDKVAASPNERLYLHDLLSEIGKAVGVLLRAQNRKKLCDVITIIPKSVFLFIAQLDQPIHKDIVNTLKKTVMEPCVQAAHVRAVASLKGSLTGAAREVCRDFLE